MKDTDKVIEILKKNFFHYYGQGEWKYRQWNFDDIKIELEQLLSAQCETEQTDYQQEVSDQEIIEFSNKKFMLGDDEIPHTAAESFCIRHGAKWMRDKFTSNNQQTEGNKICKLNLAMNECDIYDHLYHKCKDCGHYSQPQKADSEQGKEVYLAHFSPENDWQEFNNLKEARESLEEYFLDGREGYHPDTDSSKIYKLYETVEVDVIDTKENYKTEEEWEEVAGHCNDATEIWKHRFVKFSPDQSKSNNK